MALSDEEEGSLAGGVRGEWRGIHVAPAVADETGALRLAGDDGDARASHAEHVSQELLRQRKAARLRALGGHEQPACAPLFHGVEPVAGR